jgi:uncharacterized phage protein gp47/JayE
MAYTAPYVDEDGLHIPSYSEIRDHLLGVVRGIYGQDIYLDNDSADYELISAYALIAYDVCQSVLLAYHNASPRTAIGTGLDADVALNGIKRAKATRSVCAVTLTGRAGTVIREGKVSDTQGNIWILPDEVIIPDSGSVDAVAVASREGRLISLPGDINVIATPTRGWTGVSNAAAATPGRETETNTELRARQAISVAGPSRTAFEGTLAAVAAVDGVTRIRGYENDTSEIRDGLPPHSITIVAEGGEIEAIGKAIYRHKSPGCYTNGDEVTTIESALGLVVTPIRFFRPVYVPLEVSVTLKKLAGYTDDMAGQVKKNVFDFLNGLNIGESVYAPNVYAPIQQAMPAAGAVFYPQNLTVARKGESGADVIDIGLIETAGISMDDITVAAI